MLRSLSQNTNNQIPLHSGIPIVHMNHINHKPLWHNGNGQCQPSPNICQEIGLTGDPINHIIHVFFQEVMQDVMPEVMQAAMQEVMQAIMQEVMQEAMQDVMQEYMLWVMQGVMQGVMQEFLQEVEEAGLKISSDRPW